MGNRVMKPDLTPISRFPDLEKPERERLNQLLRLLILTTRGDLLTRGVTYLKRLAIGAAGTVLHSDGTDVEWAVLQANEVEVEILSGADYDDVQDFINFFGNRTLLSGGTITTEGDGDAAMASCTAWCKITDSDTAVGKFFNFDGVGNITLTDLVTNFIYLYYNGGTPQVVVATSVLTHGFKQDYIFVAAVYRSGNTLHIHQSDNLGIAGVNRAHLHHLEEFYVHRASGMVTSSVGTRQLAVATGVLYAGLNRNTTNAFNTSTGDTFSYWYYDGDLGTPAWVEVAAQDAIDSANYNDVDTGLVAHSAAAKRGVHWVYMDNDGVHLHVVYGQEDYSTAQAELATVPSSLPPIVTGYCTLIAKIIVQKDQDTLYISYPWTEAFKTSLATDHGSLAGLADDDHAQYILKSLLQNNSFVYRDNSGVLRNLFVNVRQMVGRTTTTELGSLTMAQVWANLSHQATAAVSFNNQKIAKVLAISEPTSSELTIDTDGAVAALRMFHTIDTFEDAASDDLVTISNAPKIAFTFIRPNNDARTIIVKHDTGNIWLQGKTDISLDDIEDGLLLAWDDDNSKWFDISIGAGAPPGAHDFGGVSHNADTIANLNSKVSDATLLTEEHLNAKGDLISASADDTPEILGIGANDEVLTADDGEASGMKWAAAPAPGAHKDTHDPSGADPIDTAAPDTNVTPEQANAEGDAETFARSDHMHYLPSGAPSQVGAANAEGTGAAFARTDHIHKYPDEIQDADGDTGWEVEQGADEDILRGKVAGVEAVHVSAVGIQTLAKQSVFRGYLTNGNATQKIKDVSYAYLMLDSEAYDVQNEHDNAVDTGTDDAGTAFKLSEAGAFDQADSYYVGKWVWNTTDNTYAKITVKDSINVLSISANIMANGETYKIYSPYWTCTEDGKYLVVATGLIQDPALADHDYVIIYISLDDVVKASKIFYASTAQGVQTTLTTVVDCAAGETILTKFYQNNAANTTRGIWWGQNYNSLTVLKMA